MFRKRSALLIVSAILVSFVAGGCATTEKLLERKAASIAEMPPAERNDLLTRLANLPLWAAIIRHANQTNANVDAWVKAGQISTVNEMNARLCPNALLVTVPDLQAKILTLRDAFGAIGQTVNSSDPSILVTITTLEYGPKTGRLDLQGMIADVKARFHLVENSCRGLGYKALDDVLMEARKVGLIVTTGGAGL